MPGPRRPLTIAAVIALLAIALPTTLASAQTDPDANDTLRLNMADGVGTFTYQDANDATDNLVQRFTASRCSPVMDAGTDRLIVLGKEPSNGTVGFNTHSLGIRVPGEGSSGKCEQVNVANQILKLKIGPDLRFRKFEFAELDIEAKFDAAINIAIFNGTPSPDTQVDADPEGVGGAGPDDPATTTIDESKVLVITCTSQGSDCGPDDAARDNFRERVPSSGEAEFTDLWLWATATNTSGAVALEGGADGTAALPGGLGEQIGTLDSVFAISSWDGQIDCVDDPDTTDVAENQATANDGGPLADITVTRQDNIDDAACTPKNYIIDTAEEVIPGEGEVNVVTFLEDVTSGQDSHYTMRIEWTYERRDPVDDPDANPATVGGRTFYIDYDGSGIFVPAELCPVVDYDALGDPVPAMHPDGLPWCITAQTYTIDSGGVVNLTQEWDGFGDPRSY